MTVPSLWLSDPIFKVKLCCLERKVIVTTPWFNTDSLYPNLVYPSRQCLALFPFSRQASVSAIGFNHSKVSSHNVIPFRWSNTISAVTWGHFTSRGSQAGKEFQRNCTFTMGLHARWEAIQIKTSQYQLSDQWNLHTTYWQEMSCFKQALQQTYEGFITGSVIFDDLHFCRFWDKIPLYDSIMNMEARKSRGQRMNSMVKLANLSLHCAPFPSCTFILFLQPVPAWSWNIPRR